MDTDLGASFAKEGNILGNTRGRPDQYVADTKFVKGVKNGKVEFDYHGKNQNLLKDITVEQAKWIGGILSQLSEQQVRDAFRAANYSPEEIESLTRTVMARIGGVAENRGGARVRTASGSDRVKRTLIGDSFLPSSPGRQ